MMDRLDQVCPSGWAEWELALLTFSLQEIKLAEKNVGKLRLTQFKTSSRVRLVGVPASSRFRQVSRVRWPRDEGLIGLEGFRFLGLEGLRV